MFSGHCRYTDCSIEKNEPSPCRAATLEFNMLTRFVLALALLTASASFAQTAAPMPPLNFRLGPPVASNNYPAVDPAQFPVAVTARPADSVRTTPPLQLFGFNLIWDRFQAGYWRNGRVRPEVVEWLKPFRGAQIGRGAGRERGESGE